MIYFPDELSLETLALRGGGSSPRPGSVRIGGATAVPFVILRFSAFVLP